MKFPKLLNVILGLVIAAVTLIALEFVLGVMDRPPLYFPPAPPEERWVPLQWATCDEAGCRFTPDAMVDYCARREPPRPRECWGYVNRQGFYDTDDFTAGDDLDGRMRILMLGDSFTFGIFADSGKSYVETIEANFPQTVVWNTGIPGAGTHQALALFQRYAPILQPQLTILGFFMNDFGENLLPMDIQIWVATRHGRVFIRRQNDSSEGGGGIR